MHPITLHTLRIQADCLWGFYWWCYGAGTGNNFTKMSLLKRLKNSFETQSSITQVVIVNFVFFLTVNVVGNISHLDLLTYTALPTTPTAFLFKFWTVFTYMFTHTDFWHLLWNMILFYFFANCSLVFKRQVLSPLTLKWWLMRHVYIVPAYFQPIWRPAKYPSVRSRFGLTRRATSSKSSSG